MSKNCQLSKPITFLGGVESQKEFRENSSISNVQNIKKKLVSFEGIKEGGRGGAYKYLGQTPIDIYSFIFTFPDV